MHFAYTPEQEALRREVRAFIAENVTEEVLAARGSSESILLPAAARCHRRDEGAIRQNL